MSHVEAAASLFGTSDTSQDFFSITDSASGDNTAVDTNTSSSATGSLNSDGVFDSNNSSELFGASDLGSETSNLFSNDTASDFLGNDAVVAHSTPPEGNTYGSDNQYSSQGSVSYDSSNNANSGTMDTHSQSWDSGYGQWGSTAPQNSYGNYQPVQSQITSAYNTSQPSYQADSGSHSYVPSNSYTPTYPASAPATHSYAPAQSAYAVHNAYNPATPSQATTPAPKTSPYDPYKPQSAPQATQTQTHQSSTFSTTTTSSHDPYAPQKPVSTPSTYSYASSYSSTTNSTYQSHLNPPPPIPQAYSSPSVVSAASPSIPTPTPEVKNTTPYRPAKYNAYDPPIPAAKPPKRPLQHSAPQLRATSNRYDYYSSTPSNTVNEHGAGFPLQGNHFGVSQSSVGMPPAAGTTVPAAQNVYGSQLPANVHPQNAAPPYGQHQGGGQPSTAQSPYAPQDPYAPQSSTSAVTNVYEPQYSHPPVVVDSVTSPPQSQQAFVHTQPANDNKALSPPPTNRVVDLTKSPLAYATDLETPSSNNVLNGLRSPPKTHKDVNRVSSPASDRSWARRSVELTGSRSPALDRANGAMSPWRNNRAVQSPPGSPGKGRAVSSPVRVSSPLADNQAVYSPSSPKRDLYDATARNSIDSGHSYAPNSLTTYEPSTQSSWQGVTPSVEADAHRNATTDVSPMQYTQERSLSPEQHRTEVYSPNYGPQTNHTTPNFQTYQPSRDRAMTGASTVSTSSTSQYDPYAPHSHQNQYMPSDKYSMPNYGVPTSVSDPHSIPYEQPVQESIQYLSAPTHSAYAPSPTLLGSNDPLGRATARAPIVSFGFGGKLITCFHSSPGLSTGFDVALSGRRNTDVSMRILHKILPNSAVDGTSSTFPGPLFGDPGSPGQGIVRSGTGASAKAKKAKLLAYLSERIEESSQGLGYFGAGSADHRHADGKLTLLRVLRLLVEHDGQVSGSPEIESAVRSALLPRLSGQTQESIASSTSLLTTMGSVPFGSPGALTPNRPDKVVEYTVHSSSLDKIQEFLLKGEKRLAYHYALDEKLWAHAMVISSSIDKDAFREVVNEFIKTELCTKEDRPALSPPSVPRQQDGARGATNGRECLRLAYSLYSGQTVTAVQQLALPSRHPTTGLALSLPTPQNQPTPISPNFPSTMSAVQLAPESLANWHEYAATLFSGQMGADSSSALTALGDCLLHNDAVEAAHCCYLLSPLTSPIGGHALASARVNLIGVQSPQRCPGQAAISDAIVLSEIAEYAFSLRPTTKGQEPFIGFPHLIAYRLVRAHQLAELGQMSLARRYCEAITTAIGTFKTPHYITPVLLESFTELTKRLLGAPELDKANSWIPGKIAKPSLDSIGDWLGGRLSKFVVGETEGTPSPNEEATAVNNSNSFTGAFSHYSSISSATTSTSPSPAPSIHNTSLIAEIHQRRSGSAMAIRQSPPTQLPTDRASSAMDYRRPSDNKHFPHRMGTVDSSLNRFAQPLSLSQAMESSNQVANGKPVIAENNTADTAGPDSEGGGWWSSAYGDSNGATPTATTFYKVDDAQLNSTTSPNSGFISLMDNMTPQFSASASSTRTSPTKASFVEDDLEDDLGLGNSKKRPSKEENESVNEKKEDKPPAKEVEKKTEEKPASGSWFGRWWGRGASNTPGPVKANLGEETSFYYDKDLKRWVNKNSAPSAAAPSTPPPPPSRAQTASPMRAAAQNGHSKPGGSLPPPPRPATAFESGGVGPPKTIPRVRSSLVPSESTIPVPPSPALSSSLSAPPPPTSRPASSASRRNVRSRYVDVFKDQAN